MIDGDFDDSRRLTGPNPYFPVPGAALEARGSPDHSLLARWRQRVLYAADVLAWPVPQLHARVHASGVTLALTAPQDQLLTATEVNEWAWLAAVADAGLPLTAIPHAPGHPAIHDDALAMQTLHRHSSGEANPLLMFLLEAAGRHGVLAMHDEQWLCLGSGEGSACWPLSGLPTPADVAWSSLRSIPLALVTGSNGKTTTVRLLAAILRSSGKTVAYSSTDGLYLGTERIEAGDYSGPTGARAVLRRSEVQAAVLESARGGLLRRGLAVDRADVAVVTNISDDHFGEYGVHDLEDLAAVKLSVAHALGPEAPLVLNAEDPLLRRLGPAHASTLAWFALDASQLPVNAARTCSVLNGRLHLRWQGHEHDLGLLSDMPLSFAGRARYNIANMAAAALAAMAMGAQPQQIAAVLGEFGRLRGDNPGRLQHWQLGGLQVFVDYAHNPDGLRGLLDVACAGRAEGRLGLLLGQAGNRADSEIRALAAVAASYAPQRILLKDIEGYMRGRKAGEVAALMRDELLQRGVASHRIATCLDETAATRDLLAWARAGDRLVLPIHGLEAREQVVLELDARDQSGWLPG